jgi:di/tricarboxylate transporter
MLLSWFGATWLNNHTAPVLVTSLLAPLIRDLPRDSPFVPRAVIAVAIASNLGGMASPLASLQNILAVQALQMQGTPVGFAQWVIVCGGFSLALVAVAWAIVTAGTDWEALGPLPPILASPKPLSRSQTAALAATAAAALALATAGATAPVVGGITAVSMIFLGGSFGTGLLPVAQVHSFPWPLILLIASASSLSTAIEKSRLLPILAAAAMRVLSHSPAVLAAQLLLLVTVIASCVSHTVAALVLLPLVSRLAIDIHMPVVLPVAAALCINAAMALPFSSFPNLHALALRSDAGTPLVKPPALVKVGAAMTVIGYLAVVVVGVPLVRRAIGD